MQRPDNLLGRGYRGVRERAVAKRAEVAEPKSLRTVPEGCVDVWQVVSYRNSRAAVHGTWRGRSSALGYAEKLLREQGGKVQLDHKAAILLNGKYHIVHLNAIQFEDPLAAQPETPTVSNGEQK